MIPQAGSEYEASSFERHVFQNAFNIPLTLSEAPTTAGGQLPRHGDNGFYGTNWYVNLGGTIYRFAGTAV